MHELLDAHLEYCILGIRSIYWVLGHCELGPYALDTTSRATALWQAWPRLHSSAFISTSISTEVIISYS